MIHVEQTAHYTDDASTQYVILASPHNIEDTWWLAHSNNGMDIFSEISQGKGSLHFSGQDSPLVVIAALLLKKSSWFFSNITDS